MKTILLADDEANLRMLVRTTLDDPNCRIIEAGDGTSALELARREQPDLLVLDWMMPGLTGIEVARALREDPQTAHIPIIMLTAKGQDADKDLGLTAGAYAYLVKPFSPLELIEKVEEVTSTVASELPEPSAEVQRELDMANSQLALYARDLKRIAGAERRKARDLADANARLRILDQLKMDFLTFVSHELRTPLQIIGAVNTVDPHGDPHEQAELLDIVRRGYERLDTLIRKGLEYFGWLAAERGATSETCDLGAVVTSVVRRMPGLAAPGVDFRMSSPGHPCLVHGEAKHLAEVVKVLLDNALKFSQEDKTIRVDLHAGPEKVGLAIADRGQGFSPELARELFRPFTIADVIHHSQGTGLNLALASAIVQAFGGQIRAESLGLGKGATFTVEFPSARGNGERRSAAEEG